MKRMLLLSLLLMAMMLFSGNMFAQLTIELGQGTAVNTTTGAPSPYGTWYKAFRQQFLILASELEDEGGGTGNINSLAFNVQVLNNITPMNNFRIRFKHTNQTSLSSTFETGTYEQVFQAASFLPTLGWNTHNFTTPFVWDGTSNILVDIVTDVITGAYAQNASTYYTPTTFSSSLRFQSDSQHGTTATTGTLLSNRSNMRLSIDMGNSGSLSGTVSSGGINLDDVVITVLDTPWSQVTDWEGQYSFPFLLAGDYQVQAQKVGFENQIQPVTIVEDEESILDFELAVSTSVLLTGTVVGSDNPTVGLSDATVSLSGLINYETVTNDDGQFGFMVLSGNTYNWYIERNGYQFATGTVDVGNTTHDMGTIILDELTLPPGPVLAELNASETAVNLTWSPPGGTGSGLFFDFEFDDGGWEPSGSLAGASDWEYTDNYDVADFVIIEYHDDTIPPPSAYSGTGMWGTLINTNHSNSNSFHYLSKTFDFSNLTDATLRFMSFENVYGDWDYCQISVNGTLVWGPSWEFIDTQWLERIIDLSAYDGMDEVTIRFEMFATSVRAYAGWYIDDVEIGMASQFAPPTVSAPKPPIRYAGSLETDYIPRSEKIVRDRSNPQVSPRLSSSQSQSRLPVGYRVWRLTLGQEDNEDSWTELTTTATTDTTLSDTAWQTLPHTIYKWAVKTVYTNNVLSEPRFSNPLRLQPDDLSALEIYGNTTPTQNSSVTHTVVVKNTGTASQSAGSYTVKIMHGNTELASGTGPAIAVNQEVEVPLSWTPTTPGAMAIHGLVVLPGDSVPDNDQSPPLNITVMDEGLFVLQLGDGTAVNGDTGAPAPYGTWYKSFRQQFLYKADEIYAMGGAPGLITALAFNVQSLDLCSPMPNYRIRLKHTSQATLSTTFETGTYQQVFQSASFMPITGWNMHGFTEPFIWNGSDNILVDIVVDLFQGAYTRNALVYYSPTTFNSSLRYQSDTIAGDTATTGTILANRSNTRFFMVIDDMGSLSGTVTENGHPVPNMLITVEDTVFNTTTNHNGAYSLPFVPAGTQTVTASKNGYTPVSHTVMIEEDEETVQNFNVVGTPEFALSEDGWDFGDITIGGSSSKTIQIINAGGGELTISSIVHSGSGSFVLTQPNLPVTLRTDQTIDLPITFTPAVLGEVTATFTITDDRGNRYQITGRADSATGRASSDTQDSRDVHELIVTGNGVHSIHVGNGGENVRMPYDFYWKTSMFQTIFSAADINDFIGMITGIKLYNNFTSNLTNKPIKLWLGSTTQNDLSAGWISSNDMTLVFDGNMNFPSGQNTITINFPEPFLFIEGGNLVLLAHRPMDTGYHSSLDYFDCQTMGSSRSRNYYSDSVTMNPESMAPSDGTVSGQFPRITFEVIPGGVGHIEGIVRGEDGSPLPGVLVNVDVRASATTNQYGEFHIHNLLPNDYTVTLSRYGYLTQTIDITIEEDVTEEMDITMEEMPQVSILGTVVASDTGDGIADATLSFTGYADYTATTSASGEFIVDSNVYAYNTYDYVLTAAGYTAQTGSIEVGPQDYDMGVITMEELAFAPTQVEAALSDDYSSVNIGWNPPDPDAFEIVESFEGVAFPPTDWTQTITNNGVPNMHGVRPTWCRFSLAEGVAPSDGDHQAGLAWIAEHQDE
ncbi:MAG TPA: choice-of-anchor D domain-containing protein, partial [Candidatus Cloacimonetes bacterium]|nr:choice-of-anchor D domain-containing protein [Candidatus Cloacimonadota bacterium]